MCGNLVGRRHMWQHLKNHEGSTKSFCSVCGKEFPTASSRYTCWISNFCPYQTIFISYNFPIDFDIPNLTEGTISENATRRSTSRRRSSRASFAASPSFRKSTWRPTRESTQERNRESFCPLDDYSNLSSQDSHLIGTPASIARRGSSRGHGATNIKLRAKPGMHFR